MLDHNAGAGADLTLLVVAYPELAADDRAWIEQARAAHHPRAQAIAAHFTLIFPTTQLSLDALLAHVAAQTREAAPISFVLRWALPFPDPDAGMTDVVLIPEEGFAALARLADWLYRGVLAPTRRLDLPMIPHLTAGRFATPPEAAALAETLTARPLAIPGRVTALEIVERGTGPARTVGRVALDEAGDQGSPAS